jgi:hypothetical protein
VLRAAAVAALVVGVLLGLGSWDGLYDSLDLPQALPALSTQLGGAGFLGLAYLLWAAAPRPELAGVAAGAGAIAEGAGAVVIAAWLIFRDRIDMPGIDDLGYVILIAVAAVFALLALAQARVALASR